MLGARWQTACLFGTAYLCTRSAVLAFMHMPRVPVAGRVWTRPVCSSLKMMSTAVPEEPSKWTTPGYRRSLHWVFKVGDLEKTLDFYEKDFGMHVHRHEEFASGCEASCNGPYGGAWSKTMCGYGQEDENFALELTCNYGIDSYETGNDLRYIAIDERAYMGPSEAVVKDEEGRRFVSSPDGYKYLLVDTGAPADSPAPKEPFLFVSIHVADIAKAEQYYRDVLGACLYYGEPGSLRKPKTLVMGFDDNGVKLELVQLPAGETVDFKLASGRFAVETEDGAPDYIAEKVKSADGTILHGPLKLQPHGEEVVIVKDTDGYEFCFVDARGYKKCVDVRDAKDGRTVNWEYRKKLDAAARSGPKAKVEVAKVLAGDYDKAEVRGKISNILKDNDVVVFAQVTCPYCAKAKALLKELNVDYKLVEVDALGVEGYAFRVELNELTGRSSVPNIFIRGQNIGGFGDGPGLETLHQEGKLLPLLSGKATLAELTVKATAVKPAAAGDKAAAAPKKKAAEAPKAEAAAPATPPPAAKATPAEAKAATPATDAPSTTTTTNSKKSGGRSRESEGSRGFRSSKAPRETK